MKNAVLATSSCKDLALHIGAKWHKKCQFLLHVSQLPLEEVLVNENGKYVKLHI